MEGKCVLITEDEDDNCEVYHWVDLKGKFYSKWMSGCKKVCKKCVSGYYLNKNHYCVEYPPFCVEVNHKGVCTKCIAKYILNDWKECVLKVEVDDYCKAYEWVNKAGHKFNKWTEGC